MINFSFNKKQKNSFKLSPPASFYSQSNNTNHSFKRFKITKKFLFFFYLILFLVICLIYTSNIEAIPDDVILFYGENLNLNTIFGISLEETYSSNPGLISIGKNTSIQASSKYVAENNQKSGKSIITLKLFRTVPIKEISVNVIPITKVVPLGNVVGLKLYTNGVLVVGMSEIDGKDNNKYKPYESTGIKEGDMIIEIDKNTITCTNDLIRTVETSGNKELSMKYVRDGNVLETTITPIKNSKNEYKLGLWVRDTAAGIGTATFYDPATSTFACLGHGILDIDTEELLDISYGEFITTNITSLIKGEKGVPGKIQGTIDSGISLGTIYKNTNFGVFGIMKDISSLNIDTTKTYPIALRNEIKTGPATIMCTLQNNIRKEYNIEIEKIFLNNNENNKSMQVKITDPELLKTTGGIIQGMSGSPILQNGKVIGALTHVLVSDPTHGYGVFADLMVKQSIETD